MKIIGLKNSFNFGLITHYKLINQLMILSICNGCLNHKYMI